MSSEYTEKRKEILGEIDKLLINCDGCKIYEKVSKQRDNSAITRACKACPFGYEMSLYGAELLESTKSYRKRKAS